MTIEVPTKLDEALQKVYNYRVAQHAASKKAAEEKVLSYEEWVLNMLREMAVQSIAEKTRAEVYGPTEG